MSASGSTPLQPPSRHIFSSPPPDLDKPAIPYTQGQKFTVLRHTPPPPLGRPYPNSRGLAPVEVLNQFTQLEYCLSAAPLGGETDDQKTFSFVITRQLAVCDGRGAQVVVVSNDMVAKIYDPLYYPAYYEDSSMRNDVVDMAERDYSREAAAYEELGGRFGGTIIPKYYGSWTCEIPGKKNTTVSKRPVRLILMEYINGMSLVHLDPKQLSEDQKSNIMVKAIEAHLAIRDHGVIHGDFNPRNVITSGSDPASGAFRVALVDFNYSRIPRLWGVSQNSANLRGYRSSILHNFICNGWVPDPPEEWLSKHFGSAASPVRTTKEPSSP